MESMHYIDAVRTHFQGDAHSLIYKTINSDQLSEPQCLILAIQEVLLGKKKLRGHIGRVNILDAGRFR